MSVQEAKAIYNSLKSAGELKTMYSSMTGDWHKDQALFMKQYKANEELIENFSDDLDEDENF